MTELSESNKVVSRHRVVYLRDIAHRFTETLSVGLVVVAQQIM